MKEKLARIEKDCLVKVNLAKSLKELDNIFLSLFGKNGEMTLLPKDFPKLSKDELRIAAPLFNKVKTELEKSIEDNRIGLREESYKKLESEELDLEQTVELPKRTGHLHPTTQFIQETVELFKKIGFQEFEAPQIDTDEYNFELLNIPKNHPARDLWDTLYINNKTASNKTNGLLLRTHTSNAQIRIMKQLKLPIRMMSIGRCFRYENLDTRHEHTFEQFELVYVDKGLNMANLQYLSEYFIRAMIGKDIKARLRPKYYH